MTQSGSPKICEAHADISSTDRSTDTLLRKPDRVLLYVSAEKNNNKLRCSLRRVRSYFKLSSNRMPPTRRWTGIFRNTSTIIPSKSGFFTMAHFPGSDSVLIRHTVDLGTIYAENERLEDTITT